MTIMTLQKSVKRRQGAVALGGLVFGRLSVLGYLGDGKWECRCECSGKTKPILTGSLTTGRVNSCGCPRKESLSRIATKHGARGSLSYGSWRAMMGRCYDEKNNSYKYYGAKGIGVCADWHNFANFYRDMGDRSPGLTLERTEGSKGYSAENCAWATYTVQARNKRNNRLITYKGITKPLAAWCSELKVPRTNILMRLNSGWPVSLAFEHLFNSKRLKNLLAKEGTGGSCA